MLHIITIGSNEEKLQHLKNSVQLFNTTIQYIHISSWGGFYDKISHAREYISKTADGDIICFIDAYDVLCNASQEELVQKFLSMDCDILFAAETNCYPPKYEKVYTNLFKCTTNHKFVNSGGFIGRKEALLDFFFWLPDISIMQICRDGGDQSYFTEYFIEHYGKGKYKIKIDTEALIFLCMFRVHWDDILFQNGRAYNVALNNSPCFFHFNGSAMRQTNGEDIMPVFVEKMIATRGGSHTENLEGYLQCLSYTCCPLPQRIA